MKKSLVSLITLAAAQCLLAGTLTFECSTDKKSGVYKVNEKIIFTATLKEDGKTPEDKDIHYTLFHGSKKIKKGKVPAKDGLKIETSVERPDWARLEVRASGADGKFICQKNRKGKNAVFTGLAGAIVSPREIKPFTEEPADFDQFWLDAKKELAAVPLKVRDMKALPGRKGIRIFDVKISCAGEKPVSGILCIPEGIAPKSVPALVNFHGAGVRSAKAIIEHAMLGAITFDVNAHGIENGKPKKFYADLRKNYYYKTHDKHRQNDYYTWYKHDPQKYYMRGMFLRVLRALEYVKTLPEWDGKHLAISGTSQGGTQSIVAAALDKDVTFLRAGVPGWCDISGVLTDRMGGGGDVYTKKEAEETPALVKNLSYFDCMFFARRIKCPTYINTGLIDVRCYPSGVFAAYNQIPAATKKYIQVSPKGGHSAFHAKGHKALKEYIKKVTSKGKAK